MWKWLRKVVKRKRPANFTMGDRDRPGIPGAREDVVDGVHQERPPFSTKEARDYTRLKKEQNVGQKSVRVPAEDQAPPHRSPFGGMPAEERAVLASKLSKNLDDNIKRIMHIFHAPRNSDLVVRHIEVKCTDGALQLSLFYLQGMTDSVAIENSTLRPLLQLNIQQIKISVTVEDIHKRLLPTRDIRTGSMFSQVIAALLEGESALVLDGDDRALIIETRLYEHRAVEESPTEAVVRGPHFGFVENFRANIGLIRTVLSTPDLVVERFYLGARSHQIHALLYVEGIVNPKLVEEARRRMSLINADWIGVNTIVDRFIEDHPWSPIPTTLTTERPDRVASALVEGHVAIINSSPGAIVVPTTIWALMHNPEDMYVHFIPGSLLRLVRWLALFITIYASALYIAVSTYHPEMLPAQLLYSLAASREVVPFPAAAEAFGLEIGFELIREAGIRIPSIIGPTIGIVGAVILGQAAVQARIISPILVVVVAASGLGSFAIPNYNLSLAARVLKIIMLLFATVLGIPGITFVTLVVLAKLMETRSFGVPMTSPVVPSKPHSQDTVLSGPEFRFQQRPGYTRPLNTKRQSTQPRAGGFLSRLKRSRLGGAWRNDEQ